MSLTRREELEEELVFTEVQISSLDPESDTFTADTSRLEQKYKDLESRLESLNELENGARNEQASSWPENNTQYSLDTSQQQGDEHYGAGMPQQANSLPMLGQERLPSLSTYHQSSSRGAKRPVVESHDMYDLTYPNKRATPEPPATGNVDMTTGLITSSRPLGVRLAPSATEMARQRLLQRETELQRQQEDAEYARHLSLNQTPFQSRSATPSSSGASFQSTFDPVGTYHRPNIKQGKKPVYTAGSPYQPSFTPQPSQHWSPPLAQTRFVKREPHVAKREHVTPRDSSPSLPARAKAQVVDLTGDSDDEVAEVMPLAHHNQPVKRPVQYPSLPTFNQTFPSLPGAYPTSVYNPAMPDPPQHLYNNSGNGHMYNHQQPVWYQQLKNSTSNMYQNMRNALPVGQLDQISHLMNRQSTSHPNKNYGPRAFDDDMQIIGSRTIDNLYANRQALYQQRYDTIASYDPEKTKEEIENLLNNIRPDEELPDHLLVRTPEEMNVRLHKYQELGLTWLKSCEEGNSKGGILADDMGLGKTIQMLSLIVTRQPDRSSLEKTTLIIAPVALLRQWRQEINDRIKPRHRLSVYIHHGQSKKKTYQELMSFDVVLTTYGSIASEVKKYEAFKLRKQADRHAIPRPKEKCILINTERPWYRVILDEAQCIKNRNTQSAKGARHLNATYRFCCTGTPMMNNVEEFHSLLLFLRIKPYCIWENFRTDFALPLRTSTDPATRATAMRKFQAVCKAVMLRRTKHSKYEGRPILTLPERTTDTLNPEFSEDERAFYDSLENKTQLQFNKYLKRGEVGTHYSAILVLLLRLRQACCHPHLIKDFGVQAVADVSTEDLVTMAKELSEEVIARIKDSGDSFECAICCDGNTNPAIFVPCGHNACHECFSKIVDQARQGSDREDGNENVQTKCHICRQPVHPKRITDFLTFKKVHWREKLSPEELEEPEEDNDDDELADDSDDDTGSDEGDIDEDETLNGFIVRDDVVDDTETETEETEPKVKDEPKPNDQAPIKDEDDERVYNGDDLFQPTSNAGPSLFSGVDPSSGKVIKGKAKSKKKQPKKSKKARGKQKKDTKLTLAELKKLGERNMSARKKYLKRLHKNWISSAKIEKTMEILQQIMASEEGEKVLVFSQWTSLLDLVEVPVAREGWGYRRYDGSMNPRARADAVDDFRDTNKEVRIMLVSLKAGNAGLNLNMANQVIILDPFWNPYIEEQAIDRAHRLGQQRPVKVHRVLIEKTIESKIIELQEHKRALISEALDEKASQSIGRLGVRELAYLFGVTNRPDQQVNYRPRERR